MFEIYLLLIFFCVAMSALSNATETAFTAADLPLVTQKALAGDRRAQLAQQYMNHPDRFLATVLMNSNLWNVAMTTLTQLWIGAYIINSEFFRSRSISTDQGVDELITGVTVTVVGLIFCEMVPKSIARVHADQLVLILARPLAAAEWILKYPIRFCIGGSRLLLKLIGGSGNPEQSVSKDDLKAFSELIAEQHLVRGEVAAMLKDVLDLNTKTVSQAMIPLVEIISVPDDATINDLEKLTTLTGFSRFPVYHKKINQLIGVVNLRRILEQDHLEELPDANWGKRPLEPYIDRSLSFVPEVKNLRDALTEMLRDKLSMMAVVDEFGGVSGIITPEDVTSELMGGLAGVRSFTASRLYRRIGDDAFECRGRMNIRMLEDLLGMKFDSSKYQTVAGLVLRHFERFPAAGETFDAGQYRITVLSVEKCRILRVRFARIK